MIFNTLDVELKENKMAKCDPFDCIIIDCDMSIILFLYLLLFIYIQ